MEEGFVPAVPRREKKDKKAKQPKQEKPQPQPAKEAKTVEKKEEESKPVINENSIICQSCYKIGHTSDKCPEKKQRFRPFCNKCGSSDHLGNECKFKGFFESECYYCGANTHFCGHCPEREKIVFVGEDDRKKECFRFCLKCGEFGHTIQFCKDSSKRRAFCFRCGEEGHTSSECKQPKEDESSFTVCYRCGELGHQSSECKVVNKAYPDVCPLCGQIGHTVDECPSDMPSASAPVKEEKREKAPAKKVIKSADLKDTDQFPSL